MYREWTIELKAMAERIISMRQQLFNALQSRGIMLFLRVWQCKFMFMFVSFPSLQLAMDLPQAHALTKIAKT